MSFDAAQEGVQDLIVHLQGKPLSRPLRTRLGGFEGSSSLLTWLAIVLRRRLLAIASSYSQISQSSPALEKEVTAQQSEPKEVFEGKETAVQLRKAFDAAWDTLTSRESLVLVAKYRDGRTQRELARLLRISESRVSRVASAAVERLKNSLTPLVDMEGSGTSEETWKQLCEVTSQALGQAAISEQERVGSGS